MKTITFRVGKKEGPTAQHRGLYQIFGDRTLWKIGSLSCPAEIDTTV